jgi:hypothetical protein
MLFVEDRTRKPNFPRVLDDELWKRIRDRSKLPLEARYHIDNMIGLYRQQLADAETKHPGIWKKLDTAREAAIDALAQLEAVISESSIFAAIAMGIDGQRELPPRKVSTFRRRLKEQRKQLQDLVAEYENAIARVHNRKPGRKTGHDSLLTLVGLLNQLHKAFTGRRISRSGNRTNTSIEFVWDVCHRANRTLTRSTVEEAAKEVIRGDRDYELPGLGSEELIPTSETQANRELHVEANCSFMPISLPIPVSITILASKSKNRGGIHWRDHLAVAGVGHSARKT